MLCTRPRSSLGWLKQRFPGYIRVFCMYSVFSARILVFSPLPHFILPFALMQEIVIAENRFEELIWLILILCFSPHPYPGQEHFFPRCCLSVLCAGLCG